jgi:uncharacterized protein (TIGR02284 family)
MSDTDKTISSLNTLIGVAKDGQKGFANAAEHAKSQSLKTLFSSYSAQCSAGAAELQNLVRGLGGDAKTDGTVSGAMHRGLVDIKAAVSGHTDHAILVECEKGEDVAKKAYSDALKEDLPDSVRLIVARQNLEVITHHDTIRDLRDETIAA